ncbi:MAG: DNA glycosylase [Verrucomicrobiota bacterium]
MSGAAAADPAWRPLALALAPHVLAETLDGGQAFRWARNGADNHWRGVWGRHVVEIRGQDDGCLWRPLTPETTATDLLAYLGHDDAWEELADALPWRSDSVLATARAAFPGLRILAQPLGETLLAFLCSSSKQIVQIKVMLATLAERFGEPLTPTENTLPGWPRLASVSEADLRACKLGYRARYIAETAQRLAAEPAWEARLASLPEAEAHAWLCSLPGVGTKVADCVLLFGARRLEAFPVDTWILKILTTQYSLTGWTPAQIRHFGRAHFGAGAGLAQQYLFAAARRGVLRAGPAFPG